MFKLTVKEIGEALGYSYFGQADTVITGLATDSREVQKNDLFVAIIGEKVDGHNYMAKALQAGATAVAISRAECLDESKGYSGLLIEDGVAFVQKLGRFIRHRANIPVVAVTGSSGKTTTKDLLKVMLEELGPVVATIGNQNNELGLPLTLCQIDKTTKAVVVEMGMRGLGQIDFLCQLAQPDYGLITNIGKVHSELLGSQENIARAKAELLPYISSAGAVVLNEADRIFLADYADKCQGQIFWCSPIKDMGDVYAMDIIEEGDCTRFTAVLPEERQTLKSALLGLHNVENALQALTIARILGVSWAGIAYALEKQPNSIMRMEKVQTPQGATIYNDAYNANPDSMQAALNVLAKQKGRRVAVLGDMYELGQYEEASHRQVGEKAVFCDLALLIAVGRLGRLIGQGAETCKPAQMAIYYAETNAQAAEFLQNWLQAGDQVLVKGSHGMQMEEIVEILMR